MANRKENEIKQIVVFFDCCKIIGIVEGTISPVLKNGKLYKYNMHFKNSCLVAVTISIYQFETLRKMGHIYHVDPALGKDYTHVFITIRTKKKGGSNG